MEKKRRSLAAASKIKTKMTKEQLQLAIIKKKEGEAKALKIVEQLIEPDVDPAWLLENLKDINRCHMEDVIEERAIIRLCGYVLCKKPLTVVYKQQYHISLKDKKVYDVTKRKNFCSSSCFGASNYLLEQMLTSPLWLRDKEEIPKFRIFHNVKQDQSRSNVDAHGAEVDITATRNSNQKDSAKSTESKDCIINEDNQSETKQSQIEAEKEVAGCIEDFVLKTVHNFELKNINSTVDETSVSSKDQQNISTTSTTNVENVDTTEKAKRNIVEKDIKLPAHTATANNESTLTDNNAGRIVDNLTRRDSNRNTMPDKASEVMDEDKNRNFHSSKSIDDDDVIEQRVYLVEKTENKILNNECANTSVLNQIQSEDIIEQRVYPVEEKSNKADCTDDLPSSTVKVLEGNVSDEASDNCDCDLKNNDVLAEKNEMTSSSNCDKTVNGTTFARKTTSVNDIELSNEFSRSIALKENHDDEETHSSKPIKKKKAGREKVIGVNLAAKVETSFHEWITDETRDYLFGDESIKLKAIEKIERQDKYSMICEKLNRLQFEDEQEDAKILEKPSLKPAPHFAVLKEEGEKLDLKVRAFYEGKTTFEEPPKSTAVADNAHDNVETFLPLTDMHAPLILRRKILLEKLDHILPDLLRTLAGNNDVYARASLNYTSVRCTAVKALVNTFSLSAKNIIFKTAEWTLVGLVIIKMLSLSDPYLASLLETNQANLYISMILTAYKLNSDYLNLLVSSFNPNVNIR